MCNNLNYPFLYGIQDNQTCVCCKDSPFGLVNKSKYNYYNILILW